MKQVIKYKLNSWLDYHEFVINSNYNYCFIFR